MALVRGSRASDNFAQIANGALRDKTLTLRARGLLAMMLSYPPGWSISSERLALGCIEGRDAVRKVLRELEEHGYLVREKYRNDSGQWVHNQIVYDTPDVKHHRGVLPSEPADPFDGDPGEMPW